MIQYIMSNLFLLADPLSYWKLIYAQVEGSSRKRVLDQLGSRVPPPYISL